MPQADAAAAIARVVASIPRGRVATYGQVAALAGRPGLARRVGSFLRDLPEGSRLPWHRVVNAAGRLSTEGGEQRRRLRREGVSFSGSGRIDLAVHAWDPFARRRR